jgi:CubicO group peptidase (beta-lactamase class C family)
MKPETVGVSSARLARLDDLMKRRYVDGGHLPGMLTYVYRKGHLVHTGLCGHIDLEEGLIGLDDAAHSHIPAWKDLGVYASGMPVAAGRRAASFLTTPLPRPMKIVNLATHTSGLTYGFMMRTPVDAAYRKENYFWHRERSPAAPPLPPSGAASDAA